MVSLHCIRVTYFVFCGPHVVGRVKEDMQLKWSAIFGHITMWHQKKKKKKRWSKNFKTQAKYLTCAVKLTCEIPITTGTGRSMPWCAKIHYCTHTHVTHFGITTGLPAPVLNAILYPLFIRSTMSSIVSMVFLPGLPPNCTVGRRLCISKRYEMCLHTKVDNPLGIVSISPISWWAFATL